METVARAAHNWIHIALHNDLIGQICLLVMSCYFGHDKRNGFVQSLRILFDFWNLTASVHRRLDLHGLVKTWLKSPKINPLASKSEEEFYHQFPSETG
jgi:hypothetical protein